jgi:hypothetical protein
MFMPTLSPKRFRTLGEANEFYAKSQSSAVNKPIPKVPAQPVAAEPIAKPPEKPPQLPGPTLPINPQNSGLNLSAMSPKRFAEFLSDRTGPELKLLLSRECGKPGKLKNDHVVAELYREIKRRKL